MLPEKIIFIGVAINLLCSLLYVRNIFYGTTRPNLISWSIWACAPFVGFFLQLKAGAGFVALGAFMAGFGPLLVIGSSLFKRNVFWKIQFFDIMCGFLSVLAIIFYFVTSNLVLSIFFALLSDLLAFVPTFIKSWKFPETESSSTYIGGVINNTFSLLIIKNWTFTIYSFPLYLLLANLVEVSFIYRQKILEILASTKA